MANVTFLVVGAGQPLIELVEPAGESSPVARFAQRGGGLHHLCYEVESLEEQLEQIRAAGAILVRPPLPAIAFNTRRICWVFTRERLLLEYLEANQEIQASQPRVGLTVAVGQGEVLANR
jgi:catechol 2,3-dioxygenase-like lactoylglutathione lyase family enzyme